MDLKNEFSKLFAIGTKKERKSIYLHKPIIDAIDLICKKTGKDFSDVTAQLLDSKLTDFVNVGYLEAPTGGDTKTPDLKLSKASGS